VKIVLLPEGEDPDSFCRKHTLDEVNAFISANEKDFIRFKAGLLISEAGNDPLKKANLINDIADTVSKIPDPVKRSVYIDDIAAQFGIESSILFDRVNKTRYNQPSAPAQTAARQPSAPELSYVVSEPAGDGITNMTLAQSEKDLLGFLITNGCDYLDFESDSEYYSGSEEEKKTVADFIAEALGDGRMGNEAYAELYEAYYDLYYEGFDQQTIVKKLLDSENRRMAGIVADLSTQKYQLTMKSLEASLTITSSWLVTQVPKALLVYQERRMQDQTDGIRRALATASAEESVALMQRLVKLQAAQRRIKLMLGREKEI